MAGKKKGGAALPPRRKKGSLSQRFVKDIRRNWILYLLLLPGLLSLILFKIGPVGGMVIAFEKFSAFQGILGSTWVGLATVGRGQGPVQFLIGQRHGILPSGFQPLVQFVTVKAIAFAGLGGRDCSFRQLHVERAFGNA